MHHRWARPKATDKEERPRLSSAILVESLQGSMGDVAMKGAPTLVFLPQAVALRTFVFCMKIYVATVSVFH